MGESESESERAGERGDKGRWRKCGLKTSEQLIYKEHKERRSMKEGNRDRNREGHTGSKREGGREGERERAEARD